ncbi:phospholipase [Planctomycetota bacterium]|nr:phospholipase [Planctomycetota bacterium]
MTATAPPLVIIGMIAMTVLFPGVSSELAAGESADQPEARTFSPPGDAAGLLRYRFLAPPQVVAGNRYPLLLCLHGAGERGEDNSRQVGHFRPLFSGKNRTDFPAFVVIPQVPTNQLWATAGWSTRTKAMAEAPSPTLALVRTLIDELVAKEPIDVDRLYLTGLSMGGYGTWEAVQRWPTLFAAAVPICGGGDPGRAKDFARLPIWAFHGDDDQVIALDQSQQMIIALESAGGTPKFTHYPGVAHKSWVNAYGEPDLLPWLFSQKRTKAP